MFLLNSILLYPRNSGTKVTCFLRKPVAVRTPDAPIIASHLSIEPTSVMNSDRRASSNPSLVGSAYLPRHDLASNRHNRAYVRPTPPPPSVHSTSTSRITRQSLPRRPSIETVQNRRSRDVVLPQWQLDAAAFKCPICGTAFSFWYRKHHCRKCGRVVCANCSPHRITIPRQFIVHPPEDAPPSPVATTIHGVEVVDLTEDDGGEEGTQGQIDRPQSSDYKIDPALGGGQEVRLCNPCVPDPNPLPHVPFSSPNQNPFDSVLRPNALHLNHDRVFDPDRTGSTESFSRLNPQVPLRSPESRYDLIPRFDGNSTSSPAPSTSNSSSSRRHSHAAPLQDPLTSSSGYLNIYGSAPDQRVPPRGLAPLLQENSRYSRHRPHASFGGFSERSRNRHLHGMDTTAASVSRPQLREEDECPMCHQALPPRGPDSSETAREAHIQSCIESHFSLSGSRLSDPPPSASPSDNSTTNAATPPQGSMARSIPRSSMTTVEGDNLSPPSLQQRRRVAGMLVYNASEKDCVGADGEGSQECVICFEEFTVGDEMGRLECLCKFHKRCIRQWWDTKGPGACPVHQEST